MNELTFTSSGVEPADDGRMAYTAIAYTGDPVRNGGITFTIDASGIDCGPAHAMLINHNPDLVAGTINKCYVDGRALMVDFSVEPGAVLPSGVTVRDAIESGAVGAVSIRASFEDGDYIYDEENKAVTVSHCLLREISLTPVPADTGARILRFTWSENNEEVDMSDEAAVEQTVQPEAVAGNDDSRSKVALSVLREAQKFGVSLSVDEASKFDTVEAGLAHICQKLYTAPKAPAHNAAPVVSVTADESDKLEYAFTAGLAGGNCRDLMLSAGMPREYVSASPVGIQQVARRCAKFAGADLDYASNTAVAGWIMQNLRPTHIGPGELKFAGPNRTSDNFSSIITNVVNLKLLQGFGNAPSTFERWCVISEEPDFQQGKVAALSAGRLVSVPEGGQIPEFTYADGGYNVELAMYAGTVSLSFQALVNDRLDEFMRMLSRSGYIAGRTLERLCYYALLNATWTHDTTTTAGLGTAGNVDKTRNALLDKKDMSGEAMQNPARYCLVDPSNAQKARTDLGLLPYGATTYMSSAQAIAGNDDGNGKTAGIEIVESVYVGDTGVYSSANATDYYMVCDPQGVDTVRASFLRGVRNPMVIGYDAGSTLASNWKIAMPFKATIATHTDNDGNARITGAQKATA